MPLTANKVRTAKPKAKPCKLADGGGLFLLVTPAGSKLWRYKYRHAGKEQLLSFGAYPDLSLADARARHTAARALLAAGKSPSLEKRLAAQREAADTFGALFAEWVETQRPDWAPSNIKKISGLADANLLPNLRVRVALNGVRAVFHRPHPERVTDKGAVKSVRRFLESAEVRP